MPCRSRRGRSKKIGVKACKVTDENIFIKEVPGAYELPYAAKLLAMSGTVDAIICCGVLVKGDTMPTPGIPESLNVLLHELRGLGLSIKLD